ncbi:MAG: hypothetical protein GXY25_22060 [Pirellulaceae bacterium]|jgi:predicted  nucleic acid-binding Zn-ribbon protein|nr:hypothetical protein [Thermoguttaceae bacterium]MDI9444798.1 hypothetical protein [Planctomycetota bacterium]NLZ03209.1 hypothetical protein [Pirellulaceae bacterium]
MNLVGKIFIVLIFVMSILFMGFVVAVYATHTNWRDVVMKPETGLQAQLKNQQTEAQRLTDQLTKAKEDLETEKKARVTQLSQLEAEKDALEKDRNQLNQDLARLNQDVRDAVAAVKASHDSLASLQKEVEGLRTEIRDALATKDKSLAELVDMTDRAHALKLQMDTVRERMVEQSEELNNALAVLRKFQLKPDPNAYLDQPTRGVGGIVEAVRDDGLLQINIGADDGLRKGHRLDAYRLAGGRSTYLGKIEVIQTQPDKAVCKALPEFREGIIQANDRVSTGLESQ